MQDFKTPQDTSNFKTSMIVFKFQDASRLQASNPGSRKYLEPTSRHFKNQHLNAQDPSQSASRFKNSRRYKISSRFYTLSFKSSTQAAQDLLIFMTPQD
jgi:hypothetical protein